MENGWKEEFTTFKDQTLTKAPLPVGRAEYQTHPRAYRNHPPFLQTSLFIS